MFTLPQIQQAFARVRSGADFPRLVQDLKEIGVTHYDNYVAEGSIRYYGTGGFSLEAPPKYAGLVVNDRGSAEALGHSLVIHQQGQTDYLTFCEQAAAAGVEKWSIRMADMTVTYFDKQRNILVVEAIPVP